MAFELAAHNPALKHQRVERHPGEPLAHTVEYRDEADNLDLHARFFLYLFFGYLRG